MSHGVDERPSQAPLIFLNLHKSPVSFLQDQMKNLDRLKSEITQMKSEPDAALLKLARNAKFSSSELQKLAGEVNTAAHAIVASEHGQKRTNCRSCSYGVDYSGCPESR